MNTIKSRYKTNDKFNKYVLLSLMIHISFFVFTERKKDISQGDKIIPIEILDIRSTASQGDFSLRTQKQIIKEKNKKTYKEEVTNKEKEENVITDNENKSSSEIFKKQKEKKKETSKPKPKSKLKKEIGSEGEINSKQVEKGSIKGMGKIKITCLKCVTPNYPPKALRRGVEGRPIVKIWISKDGKVTKTALITKSGNQSIDNVAIKAANSSTFYPITKATTFTIQYDLKIR